ncbi:MAG: MATE family efflux transporter [Spirochaetaceae bacterium]|nr:MATE family efflux transporter [Spirochaetaceae bacterium]
MSSKNQIDMTHGSILAGLLKFSIPVICSNMLQLLFNAADVAVVGRFAGETSLAAVGSCTSLINLLINLFIGLSIGTNVIAARYFGAKNAAKIQKTVHTSIVLSIISGLCITLLGLALSKQILIWMHSIDEVLPLSALYLKIYFSGITATMVYNFGSALLRAKGDTQRPLYILLSAGIINLLLNLVFVIGFKLNVAGVALATVISQVYSAVFVIVLLVRETGAFHFDFKKLELDRESFIEIIKIGLPAGFQGVMFSVSNVQIQSSINLFGTALIAGNAAACSIEDFLYQMMNGFTAGTLTFCSQNMGAGNFSRIRKEVWISTLCSAFTGLLFGFLFLVFGRQLLGIYATNPDVIEAGRIRMAVIYPTIFICGIMHCLGNSIRGIGHSVMPVVSIMLGCCVFRVFWISVIFQIAAFHSPFTIFVSYPISWTLTSIANLFFFLYYNRQLEQKYE